MNEKNKSRQLINAKILKESEPSKSDCFPTFVRDKKQFSDIFTQFRSTFVPVTVSRNQTEIILFLWKTSATTCDRAQN